MAPFNDRLYRLLPVVYRQRDVAIGEPLRALLSVISEQVDVVDADIAGLYENWFIETCDDWAIPYVGDLIGYQPVHEAGEPADVKAAEGRLLNRFLIPRREVANTVRYRRRKGTLALLELLASDVAGWPGRAVEFGSLLAVTQALSHVKLRRGRTVDLRRRHALTQLGSPFDEAAHTVDLRRVSSRHAPGRYGLGDVGLFLWRLQSFSVTRASARCLEDEGDHCFTFSSLGNDIPLFHKPMDGTEIFETTVPGPITRTAFGTHKTIYYGDGKSLAIWARGWAAHETATLVPAAAIVSADLTDWRYRPRVGTVAVDPGLGRIAFSPDQVPEGVLVSYYYGSSTAIGGGEYERSLSTTDKIYAVSADGHEEHRHLRQAIDKWKLDRPMRAVIELADSQIYDEELLHVELERDQHLEIRAAQGARPIIRLLRWEADRSNALRVSGESRSSLTLDGLLITGNGIHIKGDLDEVVIRHTTLVPGRVVHQGRRPKRVVEPSVVLIDTCTRLRLDHSIAGSIEVLQERESENEPNAIVVSDSIVDSTSTHGEAVSAGRQRIAYARLIIRRSTILGHVSTHAVELAENSIVTGKLAVARRQKGCVRFCSVSPDSRTPRRFSCVSAASVQPVFESVRYGAPSYCQLAEACPVEIRRGADDESEMGVFHDLFQPQRDASLRIRLDEFVPAGSDVGVIYVT